MLNKKILFYAFDICSNGSCVPLSITGLCLNDVVMCYWCGGVLYLIKVRRSQ